MRGAVLLLGLVLLIGCGEKVFYLGEAGYQTGRDRATGPEPPLQLLWEHNIDAPPLGGVLFAGSLALQLTTSPSLHAFDRQTGARLGKRGYDEMACGPGVLAGELFLLGELGDKAGLRALDRRTLEERWRHAGTYCQAPAVRGDTLLVVGEQGAIRALHTADGSLLWRAELGDRVRVGPALGVDRVFAGTIKGDLVALALADGAEHWRQALGEGLRSRPLFAGEHLYTATAAGRIVAVRSDSGQIVWEQSLGALPTEGLALGAGVLVVGCVDRHLYGLDAKTGVERWRFPTEGVVRSSPQVTAQTVYGASSDGHLYALELESGRLLWKYRLDGPVLAPVTVGDGVVGVASEKQTLYVFGRR
jgi:outer membrane protein assembly factor BamB